MMWITISKHLIYCGSMKCISMQIQKKTSLNINTTHSIINLNGWDVTMIIYDNFTTLSSHETFTYLGVEYIATTFNVNTRKAIHVITIYKPWTFNPFNVLGSLSTILGCNANFLFNGNHWQFHYWYAWSKFNTTKWAPNFYGPLLYEL